MGKWVAALGWPGVKKSSWSSIARGVFGRLICEGGARLRTLGGSCASCKLFFEGCLPISISLGGAAAAGFGLGSVDFDSWKSTV